MPGSTPESLPDARTHEARGMKAREVVPVRLSDVRGREAPGAGAARKARTTPESSGDIGREGRGSRSSGREGGARANPEDSLCIQLESLAMLRASPGRLPARGPRYAASLPRQEPPRLQPRKGEVKRRGFSKRLGSCGENRAAWCQPRKTREDQLLGSAIRSSSWITTSPSVIRLARTRGA